MYYYILLTSGDEIVGQSSESNINQLVSEMGDDVMGHVISSKSL